MTRRDAGGGRCRRPLGDGSALSRELGLGARASTVRGLRVAGELDKLVRGQVEDLLEALADVGEHLLSLLGRTALATRDIAVATARDAPSNRASPDADAEEGLADVDDNAHDLSILLVLQRLADRGKHCLEPNLIDVHHPLLLELVPMGNSGQYLAGFIE